MKVRWIRGGSSVLPLAALLALALGGASAAHAADAAAGKAKYDMFCASCHGPEGKGQGPVGKSLDPPPRDFTVGDFKLDADGDGEAGTDADLKLVIENGAAAYDGSAMMAPWGPTLSDQDVENLIAYIRSLHP